MEDDESNMNSILDSKKEVRENTYEDGIIDLLTEVFVIFKTNLSPSDLRRYARSYTDGSKNLRDILVELGLYNKISSEDLVEYPDAVNNIARFILNNVIDADIENNEDVLGLYAIFASVFEEVSFLLNSDITSFLSSGGQKIATIVTLTYITLQILYNANFVRKRISMVGTTTFFDKGYAVLKRLLYRIRNNNTELMNYIERSNEIKGSVEEALIKIKSIMRE